MYSFNSLDVSGNTVNLLRKGKEAVTAKQVDPNQFLKTGIWVYFFLLVFEGALRKWVLPGLATPLLIVRDPIAIWLLVVAWKRSLLPNDFTMLPMMFLGVITLFTGFYFGHGNVFVALFGTRIFLFHFPLIFLIGNVFTIEDVVKMGKVTLWISIPMTLLIILQFYSPQSAWINRGVGGDIKGGGFAGAMGFFRPPGTFSFTNGLSLFYGFTASFIFYFLYNPKAINKIVLVAATGCLLAAIPFSISRTIFFSVCLSLFFLMLATIRKPKYLGRAIIGSMIVLFLFTIIEKDGMFQNATKVFNTRFESANKTEGGVEGVFLDRFLGGMIGALDNSQSLPFFGHGTGMGTNVGSMILAGKMDFLIAEGEWGRLIGELGPVLGVLVILLRLLFSIRIVLASFNQLQKGNLLPWMLLSYALIQIMQGQWAQPTSLGFSVLIAGLVLASLRSKKPFLKN